MNDSSTVAQDTRRAGSCTLSDASLTIVPIDIRCRRATCGSRAARPHRRRGRACCTPGMRAARCRRARRSRGSRPTHRRRGRDTTMPCALRRAGRLPRNPPPIAQVTRCCASTSSGVSIPSRDSSNPASAASRTAATSTSSKACVGTQVIRLTRPGEWPLRPARWNSRATPLGDPTWTTRSTGEKSTPRSSEDVQITARTVPARRAGFDNGSVGAAHRSVMQGDVRREIGAALEQRAVPESRSATGCW